MVDEDFLRSFVGHRIELRPSAGRDAAGPGPNGTRHGPRLLVTATVIGTTERSQLRIETNDMSVLELGDRAVFAECTSSVALLRVQGGLEIRADRPPPPVVCLLSPFDRPGAIERRQWARVRTAVPVRAETRKQNGGDGDDDAIDTVSVDLSGNGIKLCGGTEFKVGATVSLVLELPSGTVEVVAQVLERRPDGVTRLRFLMMPESVRTRIIRHVFDVQMAHIKTSR